MWDLISSWFTPTVLFLLLNFTIATIFLTSASPKPPPSPPPHTADLHRTSSVLHRLKSLSLYTVQTPPIDEPEPESEPVASPSNDAADEGENRFEKEEDDVAMKLEGEGERSLEEVYSQLNRGTTSHHRSKSDIEPAAKLVKKMRKSASSKSAFGNFKEEDILKARRPATVRELKTTSSIGEEEGEENDDVEVDSRADDFINNFKQQLKLQRLDSILRYKEMLGRGADR